MNSDKRVWSRAFSVLAGLGGLVLCVSLGAQEQAAAIPGPMQAQANQNAVAMKRELGAPVVQQKK
jgi:hypothetical protein